LTAIALDDIPVDPERSALIIATWKYQDAKFQPLRTPSIDAKELSRVLADPSIGNFKTEVLSNAKEGKLRRGIERFFADRRPDDLLLLHFSCHGVKDEDGSLYFAATDTEWRYLHSTAVSADFVNRCMSRSRSRRVVLVLDCCYSGAFTQAMLARADEGVHVEERFNGRGRVVLTASTTTEYAWEGIRLSGNPRPSVFTGALIEGLKTGDADRDIDGWISVDELYDYIYDKVREETPNQTPGKTGRIEGEFLVARSHRQTPEPLLPPSVRELLHREASHRPSKLAPFSSRLPEFLEETARLLLYAECRPGDIICREGTIGDELYIIRRGDVEMVKTDDEGNEHIVGVLGEGDYIGEVGFLHRRPRTATVRAVGNVELRILRGRDFDALIERLTTDTRGLTDQPANLASN
jgi:hypothetical protein